MRFFNADDAFFFGLRFNFNTESPFVGAVNDDASTFPPVSGNFQLLDGTPFLLLDGTHFLLL